MNTIGTPQRIEVVDKQAEQKTREEDVGQSQSSDTRVSSMHEREDQGVADDRYPLAAITLPGHLEDMMSQPVRKIPIPASKCKNCNKPLVFTKIQTSIIKTISKIDKNNIEKDFLYTKITSPFYAKSH